MARWWREWQSFGMLVLRSGVQTTGQKMGLKAKKTVMLLKLLCMLHFSLSGFLMLRPWQHTRRTCYRGASVRES